jgi:hypothetical protein
MLTELLGNAGADAREWELQGFTIAESTPSFRERTATSTAREPNPNNRVSSLLNTTRWIT